MNIAIFGSCVTRDAFAMVPVKGLCVVDYIARSSLASAFHPLAVEDRWLEALGNIQSAFQRRMVEIDMKKTARAVLRASTADLVLVDLIDERFRTVGLGESVATWSTEFGQLGLDQNAFGEILNMESPERRGRWLKGASELVDCVGVERLVLNEVFWANSTSDGDPLPHREMIDQANRSLQEMYSALFRLGVRRKISYPESLFLTDPQHKWGLSPFHYIRGFYEKTMSGIKGLN